MSRSRDKVFSAVWDTTIDFFQQTVFCERFVPTYYNFEICETETHTIIKISEHPGITATELSNFLNISLAATSKMLRKMRDKGWVKQIRNEKNNRIYNLYLTENGKEVYSEIKKAYDEYANILSERLNKFSDEELIAYSKVLKVIYESNADLLENYYKKKNNI